METFKSFIRKNIGFIATFATLIAYIFTSIFTLTETGKTVLQVVGDSSLFFGLSLFVCSLLLAQGLLDGENDPRVIATNYMFSCTVEAMSPYVNLVSEWCAIKNKELLEKERRRILAAAGLRYDDYFDKDGETKGYTPNFDNLKSKEKAKRRIEEKKLAAYEKACTLKISKLEQQILMGGAKSSQEIYNMSLTKSAYTAGALSRKAISGMAFAVVFGVYTFKARECFSWEAFVWYCLQACVCFGGGIMQLIKSRMFVVDDLRGQTLRKVNFLDECRSDIRNKPELFKEEILSLPPEKIERDIEEAKRKYESGGVSNVG